MLAVVLVGGFGTRLRPLTEHVPKPLLPVGHEPMLTRLIGRLERGGVTDVVLALGFKPEPFVEAYPDGRCHGVALHYAVEPEPLDTGGAIRFAADQVGVTDTFVVANGDVLTDLDMTALVAAHRAKDAEATIHLIGVDDPSAFGVVEMGDDRAIRRFVEKAAPGTEPSNLCNAGTYVFEPSVLDLIPPGERVSIERVTFPLLVERDRLYGHPTDDSWIDAGRPELYLAANLDLLAGRRVHEAADAISDRADVDPAATVVNTLVGAGAHVGAGTTVVDSVVLPGAVVGERAQVESSLVMGTVGEDATLIEAIIGAEGHVEAGDVVAHSSVPEPG